jgi:succinate-acetate transporter protein
MTTQARPPSSGPPSGYTNGHSLPDVAAWRNQTRIFLQPIAAPSILGLFGFAAATWIVTANLVGWFGNGHSGSLIFPFAIATGGFAQGLGAIWSYRARDGLATAVHGIWAAFWIAYGIMQFLVAVHDLPYSPPGAVNSPLGYWFFALAAITLAGFVASLAENLSVATVLIFLGAGSALLGVHWVVGGTGVLFKVAGYVTMVSAYAAFYAATAMMIGDSWGRTLLPIGKLRKEANLPGAQPVMPIEFELGEPGVKHGQ